MIAAARSGPGLLDFSSGSQEERAALRERFDRDHYALLPSLIGGALLDEAMELVGRAGFRDRGHGDIGVEECMEAGPALALLLLVANDGRLFETVRELTGCGSIGCFDGRVYRFDPASGHHDSWHSDVADRRLVAMSVNLGREPHEGGVLQIRDQRTGELVSEVANTVPGDAVIFRIAERLRHRVTPVEGAFPRVAFAGWFKSEPAFRDVLHGGGWLAG